MSIFQTQLNHQSKSHTMDISYMCVSNGKVCAFMDFFGIYGIFSFNYLEDQIIYHLTTLHKLVVINYHCWYEVSTGVGNVWMPLYMIFPCICLVWVG